MGRSFRNLPGYLRLLTTLPSGDERARPLSVAALPPPTLPLSLAGTGVPVIAHFRARPRCYREQTLYRPVTVPLPLPLLHRNPFERVPSHAFTRSLTLSRLRLPPSRDTTCFCTASMNSMSTPDLNLLPSFFSEALQPGTFQNLSEAQEFAYMLCSRLRSAIRAGQNVGINPESAKTHPFCVNWVKMLRQETVKSSVSYARYTTDVFSCSYQHGSVTVRCGIGPSPPRTSLSKSFISRK